ncbi:MULTISPECIES: hypothetical protein [unclassified Streptomyces]|uniref:hypothetical protein n=1 Tax=unclassified Streptomyces TaxID=2593676 RepID=UPI000F452297|nr:hypothetical protein [Streptomyces sp. I6]RNL71431.1 hypothetical protein EBF04_11010 [Streptomyces sp. I6]
MSALSLALLLTTAAATAVGAAALHTTLGLRRQVTALRSELAAVSRHGSGPFGSVPQARTAPAAEIRAAVAEALAEERERELAEARAFWAAQEAREAADTPHFAGDSPLTMLGGLADVGEDGPIHLPKQADFAGLESLDREAAEALEELAEPEPAEQPAEFAEDSAELAAARRRHPSHPDFVPVQTPVVTDHERTVARLEELADTATALTDVRPGPLGTLDVYVFADGTTLCMTPGHRETAEQLGEALRAGRTPVLLGGSGVSGAYSLTFSCGAGENVYILADRVIASL